MNIPIEQIGISSGTAIGGIVAIVTLWFKFQNKVERLEEKFTEQQKDLADTKTDLAQLVAENNRETKRQIEAFWSWKDKHEKEVAEVRESLSKETITIREHLNVEIAKINGSMLVTTEKLQQILAVMTEIKDRLLKLENK